MSVLRLTWMSIIRRIMETKKKSVGILLRTTVKFAHGITHVCGSFALHVHQQRSTPSSREHATCKGCKSVCASVKFTRTPRPPTLAHPHTRVASACKVSHSKPADPTRRLAIFVSAEELCCEHTWHTSESSGWVHKKRNACGGIGSSSKHYTEYDFKLVQHYSLTNTLIRSGVHWST